MTDQELQRQLRRERYPRSNRYDAAWLVEHMMGPHPLWLMEHLTGLVRLSTGERVMDLGCGKALTSIFLAREFGVEVHAVDLWIDAAANEERIREAGCSERVVPVHAEAPSLPFADASFRAILSVDAYHYFGTRAGFLPQILRFLEPGGRLGIVVPGFARELGPVPDWLAPFWEDGFETLHSPAWWRALWQESGRVTVDHCELLPGGAEDWLTWTEATDEWKRSRGGELYEREAAMLRADPEQLLGFVVAVATKK